jgi:hypothetical protein
LIVKSSLENFLDSTGPMAVPRMRAGRAVESRCFNHLSLMHGRCPWILRLRRGANSIVFDPTR